MTLRPQAPGSGFLLATALLASALSGCVLARYHEGNRLPVERVEQIEPGVTTKAEVLEWFGPPQSYGKASLIERMLVDDAPPEGALAPARLEDVLAYEFHEGRARGLLLFLFNYMELRVDSDRLVLFFDETDRVRYFGVHRGVDADD